MAAQGATLSDKSARQVYGLAQDEICRAIRMGKLQYREHSMHGSPWLRLLRREVQALVKKKYGHNYRYLRPIRYLQRFPERLQLRFLVHSVQERTYAFGRAFARNRMPAIVKSVKLGRTS